MTKVPKIIITAIVTASFLTPLTGCNTSNVSNESGSTSTTTKSIPSPATSAGVINVSSDQLQSLIDKKVTLIDVRRPEEWAQTGVIAGSKKLPFLLAFLSVFGVTTIVT